MDSALSRVTLPKSVVEEDSTGSADFTCLDMKTEARTTQALRRFISLE